jgi:hypothetical protein
VYGQEADYRKPCAPHADLIGTVQIENTKYEYEFQKYEIPKLVFDVLD